jgi:hypothetical protein
MIANVRSQRSSNAIAALVAMALVCGLAACAENATYGDPGPRPLAGGQTCQSIRAELNRMDAQGAQSKVEAVTQGRKVDAATQAISDRYNSLLNQYLGARCHV